MSTATFPWQPDQGDGTFRNPVIYADYSDPDVIRHGEDYYLISSSFNCTPGLPILHSRDLVNWQIINHAIKNVPVARYADYHGGSGVWAPAIRYHAKKFWIFFPLVDEGIYVTTAAAPAGEWSEPWCLLAGKGLIDPCPLWDQDGAAYLVFAYAKSRAGINNILEIRPISPDATQVLGPGKVVFEEPERHPTIEGPKFYQRNGYTYIFAPAGGVQTGWQTVLRSRLIYGPYEDKIVLEQGSTPINGPHQGALVDSADGREWFLHFQDVGLHGRIGHLQPVTWQDDWPVMGKDYDGNGVGEPVATQLKPVADLPMALPQTSDDFSSENLGLQWQWNANHQDSWVSLTARPKYLRLFSQFHPQADLLQHPALLLQKFPAPVFQIETKLEFFPQQEGEQAGLTVMGLTYASLVLQKAGTGYRIRYLINNEEKASIPRSSPACRFRVAVHAQGLCHFSYAGKNETSFTEVSPAFPAQQGHWIGARVGLYSLSPQEGAAGYADFSTFHFSALS